MNRAYFKSPSDDQWQEMGVISSDGIDIGDDLEPGVNVIDTSTRKITGTWEMDPEQYRVFLREVFGIWYIPGVRHLYTRGGERDEHS